MAGSVALVTAGATRRLPRYFRPAGAGVLDPRDIVGGLGVAPVCLGVGVALLRPVRLGRERCVRLGARGVLVRAVAAVVAPVGHRCACRVLAVYGVLRDVAVGCVPRRRGGSAHGSGKAARYTLPVCGARAFAAPVVCAVALGRAVVR